jgi:hypothetical protein
MFKKALDEKMIELKGCYYRRIGERKNTKGTSEEH